MANINRSTRFQFKLTRPPQYLSGPDANKSMHEIATITTGLRDFIVIQDFNDKEMRIWINELIGGSLYTIDDDDLFHDLYALLLEKGVITVHVNQN